MTPVRQPMLESESSCGRYSERVALAVFVVIACFALLGGRGPNEPDEGRYAEISREMSKSGDWLNRELKTDQSFCCVWWLMIGWVVPPFLVLSLSGSKLITYVLPLYPALALAIGGWWERVGSRSDLTWHTASIAGFFGSLIVALVAALRFTTHTIPAVPLPLLGVLVLVALGMGALTVPVKPKASVLGGGFAAASLAVWILLLSQAASWNDLMGVGASMRSLAQRIRSETGNEPMVFVYGVNVPGLDWYLSRLIHVSGDRVDHLLPATPAQQARLLSSPAQCSTLAPPGQPVFGVVKLTKVGSDWPTNTWRVVATAGSFALIQRMEGVASDSSKPPVPLARTLHGVSIGSSRVND
ncbi:MAG TPA: hypothetical protein PKM43_12350 [Verrucomicrobiota bacterium]|nr:hypothetical protein [Verrucomicrobiota bacterium]HRZ53956.1 hypothetical protein [Candidatus Paceibacterota bacterium]